MCHCHHGTEREREREPQQLHIIDDSVSHLGLQRDCHGSHFLLTSTSEMNCNDELLLEAIGNDKNRWILQSYTLISLS